MAGSEAYSSPHRLCHFQFTLLETQGIDDALIQPFSGYASRANLTGGQLPIDDRVVFAGLGVFLIAMGVFAWVVEDGS